MEVIVFARHPSGGIRTYFYYVYGDESLQRDAFKLVAPKAESLQTLVKPLDNVSVIAETSESLIPLAFTLIREVLKAKPDLVHSHGFTAGLIAVLPLWLLRVPHIITTHDVFMPGQFRGVAGRIRKWLMGRLFGLASLINPVGEDAARNFRENFPALAAKGKVIPVTNGIKTSVFQGDDVRNLRNEAGIPDDALVVGFFGRFMAQKGFGLLVNAVERWNETHRDKPLHVCCFGWGGFIREEQADIENRELTPFFHFFPSTDAMGAAIRGVDAVVMPSKWEACPLLPMEVMVSGRPLIAAKCIGMNEVVTGSPALMFEVGSTQQLLEQLERFQSGQSDIQAAFDEYRSVATKRFDVSHTSGKLKHVLEQVLSTQGSVK